MERTKGKFIGLLILGAILLLLPALGEAQVFVNCTSKVTLASRLNAAAASPTRTLFVSGVCVENVTVRNLRVIIDGQHQAILIPKVPTTATIVFRGGTTEATIQNFDVAGHINSGANPTDAVGPPAGSSCNADGNSLKGSDAIDIREGASVAVTSNVINLLGGGIGIRARNESIVTANKNTINGNTLGVTGGSPAVACGGTLAKKIAGSTGLNAASSAILGLGTMSTALTVNTDNRNTVTGGDLGLNCAQAYLTGIKAPTSTGVLGTDFDTGVSKITGNATNLSGFTPYVDPSTQKIYNKLCFTDE